MATYSTELRRIVENGIPIFDFPYDFYNEAKRRQFEENFIRHFYFREIGAETVDRFKWYLQDKMMTVFPYYNSLFAASEIEYNILDNYNVKEEYTIKRENKGKTAGVSSTRGEIMDEQSSESNSEQDGTRNVSINGTRNNSTDETINVKTAGNETENVETSRNVSEDTTSNEKVDKRFLDTPQGKLNLETTDYLTNMNLDQANTSENKETEETGTGDTTKENSGSSDTVRNQTDTMAENQSTSDTDKTTGKTTGTFSGNQRNIQDNNTRTEMANEQTETYEHTKRGNIGIDTDSDMITKHIQLQKVLRKIELMFFEECEDLFMLVY